ncbi:MAG: hypothetical protein K9I70_02245 [Chitinophagaceae bacterium]|jgi:hypothetical protein|nr:hypothetical protein [Chitinophagaceae bacterium]
MHKQFHIKLQHDTLPRYLTQSRAMHIMACILLIIYALPYLADFSDNWMMLLGISLPAITILAVTLFKSKLVRDINNNRVFRILEGGFLLMGSMHYLQADKVLPAIVFGMAALFILFLLWMEGRILQDQYIVFEDSHIEVELPLATRTYAWNELQAVMIRDEFLTLSYKDATIQQLKIQPEFIENEEGDFLFFCQDRIKG